MVAKVGKAARRGNLEVPGRHNRARGWLLGAMIALVVAVVLAAGVAGWWAANTTLIASQRNATDDPTAVQTTISGSQMPDVRGLDRETAEQVLADSGIAFSSIESYDAPAVAEAGLIVEQSPAFGATDVTKVKLGLAVPVTMPDLTGMTQEEAAGVLSGFGAGVDVTYGYSKDYAAGVVMSASPPAGEPLGQTASVIIATAGSTVPLSQLDASGGQCRSESNIAIDGRDRATALICSGQTSATASDPTWVLSRSADRFTATVGIPDNGEPGTVMPFEVVLDGAVVAQGSAAFGSSTSIDVVCSDALQLTLRVGQTASDGVQIAFGDAVLYGSDEGIARLVARG